MPGSPGRRAYAPNNPCMRQWPAPTPAGWARSLLRTSYTRESHPVALLCQIQPPRHLIDHHLDLVFIQRTGNSTWKWGARENHQSLLATVTRQEFWRTLGLTLGSQQQNGPRRNYFLSLVLQEWTKHSANSLPSKRRSKFHPFLLHWVAWEL